MNYNWHMLKQKLTDDLKASMLAKDEIKTSVLRMLKSATQYFEIQTGGAGFEANDAQILDLITKEVKKRKESIELYKQGNRQELVDREQKEIDVLMTYLPAQMSEDEVKKLVTDAVEKSGAKTMSEMGKVMGILMPQVKGKADGGMVSKLVKEALV